MRGRGAATSKPTPACGSAPLEIDVPDPDHPVDAAPVDGEPDPTPPARALVIDLHLVADGLDVTNHYGTWVVGRRRTSTDRGSTGAV